MKNIILSAPFIMPVSEDAIPDGALLIRDAKIHDIGDAYEIKRKYPGTSCRHFEDSILLPGLVNAHIHLEYSALGPLGEPVDFIPWIESLIKKLRALSDDDILAAISSAINCLLSSGITSVGEISKSGASMNELVKSGMKGIFYSELAALDDERKKIVLPDFKTLFEKHKSDISGSRLKIGCFPHSVYTLSKGALCDINAFIKAENVRCGMHASESRFERDFISRGTGPLVDFVNKFSLDTAPVAREWKDTIGYLDSIGFLTPMTHLVHLVHIDENDFPLLKDKGVGIVLCPRSNYLLKNGAVSLIAMLKHDLKIGLGSDSLASNGSFDMFKEMRSLKKSLPAEAKASPEINEALIEMATIGGASVLGIDNETGSLDAGKCADIIAVKVNDDQSGDRGFSPTGYIVDEASASDVTFTMIDSVVKYAAI